MSRSIKYTEIAKNALQSLYAPWAMVTSVPEKHTALISVPDCDFSKVLAKSCGEEEGGGMKVLAVESVYRTSPSMIHNHKSQHGTCIQQRLCNYTHEKYDTACYISANMQATRVVTDEV
jgi:hypothetical protein